MDQRMDDRTGTVMRADGRVSSRWRYAYVWGRDLLIGNALLFACMGKVSIGLIAFTVAGW